MPYKMKNGKWRAEKQVNFKRKTKVFQTKKEALIWETVQTAELWKEQEEMTPTVSCLEWATVYLDMAKERFVYKTFMEKRLAFRLLIQNVGAEFMTEKINFAIAARHLRLQNKNRSGYAANKDRKNLRAAWSWGVKYLGLPEKNPFETEKFAEVRTPRYIPPEQDMEKVLAVADKEEYAFLLALLHTAGRKSEILNLCWQDVDFKEQTISLKTRKRKDGTLEIDKIPMTTMLREMLLQHRVATHSIHFVFVVSNARKFMKRICERAEVPPFGFHSIRHLSACMMDKSGVPLGTIQAILRHKSAATTSRYLHSLRGVQTNLDGVFGGCKIVPFSKMA